MAKVRNPILYMLCLLAGLLVFSLFFGPQQALAEDDLTPREIAEKLQYRYETAKSFSADFTQETTIQLGAGRKREGKGSVVIQKPGLMRWDYTEPDPQIIVCDGKTLSIYLEKAKQLMIGDAQDYLQSDVTYTFFTGTGNILRDFDVLYPDDGRIRSEEGLRIKLVPQKPHPHVDNLVVLVDPTSFLVKQLRITDRFGSLTVMRFSNEQVDVMHARDFFVIHPPPGTEVIRQ